MRNKIEFFLKDCKVAATVDLDGAIDENLYSLLNDTGHDIHIKCLIQEHREYLKYGNSSEYCPTSSDSILCWPRTFRGVLAVLPCLDEFQGIHYDINQGSSNNYIKCTSRRNQPHNIIISAFMT
uniref:G-protein coupled receptors family 2 profile 1 domain-containing protein n=1 Tax=Megaselia scalaris TaxID=36166 RepID=T1GUS1_MEGSC